MADIVTKEQRSKMMAGIRGKGTKPELLVRQTLTADGFRYRLHRRDLPGTPDVVMPGRKIAIFVHGCFWHQHQGCKFAKLPASNENFWRHKFDENKRRDLLALAALKDSGWRILTVWECATRTKESTDSFGMRIREWIESDCVLMEIPSKVHAPDSQCR